MRALVESTWVRLTQPRRLRCARPAIAIGGSVLGGTGKTPLAIAIARYLGSRAAIVGHAHRASPGHARVVREDDSLLEVGDEALVCARNGATVVVGPTRQSAIDRACEIADVVILDGVLQLAPRAALSVLTVPDTGAPSWLERDVDVVLRVDSSIDVAGLEGKRVGLVTCLARPERILRALQAARIDVVAHRAFRDHGPAGRLVGDVDVWVASEKCALHVSEKGGLLRAGENKVHVLKHRVALSHAVRACLDRLAPPPYSEIPRT
jgi:tetraacyldisaccharide-1-P 4'-kinase